MLLLLPFYFFQVVLSELIAVQLLSRHGTRGPDRVVNDLCPNERPNIKRYQDMGISYAGVTGRGMQEIYDLGIYTYQRYIKSGFLDQHYMAKDIYVRAVGSERTLQSAVIWNNALYPAESRPVNYLAKVPPPIPVYSIPDDLDTLIEARKGPCQQRLARDVYEWDQTYGEPLWDSDEIVDGLSEMCGADIRQAVKQLGRGEAYDVGDAIKDISDAIIFDFVEEFPPLPGWSYQRLERYAKFANDQLQKRLYGKPEQVTYMNGALPTTILANFQKVQKGHPKAKKMYAFHAHREATYAMGWLMGIDFTFLSRPGIPPTAVPPATTIFFELHSINNEWFVQTWIWAPCIANLTTGEEVHFVSKARGSASIDCPATLVTLPGCDSSTCPYSQFEAISQNHIAKTGTWDVLCDYKGPEPTRLYGIDHELENYESSPTPVFPLFYEIFQVLCMILCLVFMAAKVWKSKQRSYMQLPETEE